ncbi:hypothetical protein ACFGX7_11830, partial [Pasteurella multocida]
KVSKAFPKTVISIHPVSVIFLYLKFVLLSLSANLGKKRDRQFNSMIGSATNTIPVRGIRPPDFWQVLSCRSP